MELEIPEEEVKGIMNIRYVCPDCLANQVVCNFCKKKGIALVIK